MTTDFFSAAQAVAAEAIAWRRRFHENPELAFAEHETADFVEEKLREFGYTPRRVGATGLVAVLQGKKGPGRTIGLRADMDALPGTEKTGLPFASKKAGVMHSCGHDVHTAILLGVAKLLARCSGGFAGEIKFFFQPAEEVLGGAKTFVDAGELDNVDGVAALHVMTDIETGCIAVRRGVALAATDKLVITVSGKAAHGAQPHRGIDAMVAAAQVITALQTVISRSVAPLDSAVLTLGTIRGGSAPNIIPAEVVIEGTLRSLSAVTRAAILERIREILEHTAAAFGATAALEVIEGTPPLVCDDGWVDRLRRVAGAYLPQENIRDLAEPSMGGEDFAFMLQKVPGVFWRLGARAKGEAQTHTHSATFIADENALRYGMAITCALAMDAVLDIK